MNRRRYALVFAVAVIWPVLARAQRMNDSHEPLSSRRPARELADQLQSRLGQPLQPSSLNEEQFKKLAEMFGNRDPKTIQDKLNQNPELQQQLLKMLESNPDLRKLVEQHVGDRPMAPRPAETEKLKEWLQKMQREAAERQASASSGGPEGAGPVPQKITQPGEAGITPTAGMPRTLPEIKSPRDERWQNLTRGLDKWMPKTSRDNPMVKRLVNDLNKSDFSKTAGSRFKNGPKVNWDRVGRNFKGTGRFLERSLGKVDSGRLGRTPRMNNPRLPNGPQLPSMSPPGGPALGGFEMGSTATWLVMGAALALGGFLLWRLLLRPMSQRKLRTPADEIGPWPVDPTRIRTRSDLVRAFDYLSLLQCGKSARVWHHRTVANRLGSADEQRRHSATTLADAYEHARYAPLHDDLASEHFERARRELCFLAGVSAP